MDKNKNNVVNIYDEKIHFNEKCQKIKDEWIRNCDDLNRNKYNTNIVFKDREICKNIFNSYYECYINSIKK